MEDLVPLRLAEHKAFLRLVHSAPGGGDELYLGRALPGAIERYLKCWLPLVARVGGGALGGAQLIPPVDIAWVWHLHRLAPRRYAAYCIDRFGRVLDPEAAAFQAQSAISETGIETQRLWQEHFGDEPFFQRLSGDESSPAGWGPRDPLSNQTTLCAELKEACESVRSAHGFDYDVASRTRVAARGSVASVTSDLGPRTRRSSDIGGLHRRLLTYFMRLYYS